MNGFWWQAALNSAAVVLGVIVATSFIAIPSAWLLERCDIRGSRILVRLYTLPYVLPSYLIAMAWITLANPQVGWLNLLAKNFGFAPWINIYHLLGIVLVEASTLYAVLFLSFRVALKNMDPSLEEAARLAGSGKLGVFFRITLPLLRTTIYSALIVVALASLASFGVPAMIGPPARIYVLTTGIYSLLKAGNAEAFHEAMFIAIKMGAVALFLVFVSSVLQKRSAMTANSRSIRLQKIKLGAWRAPLTLFLWSLWTLVVALPLTALVLSSFQHEPGALTLHNFSLRPWQHVLFDLPGFPEAILNSLLSASAAAGIVVLISLAMVLIQWHGVKYKISSWRVLGNAFGTFALFIHSIPGTVLALMLVILASYLPSFLSDGLGILILAYVLQYQLVGIRTLGPASLQLHPSLFEAAQLSGARFGRNLWHIWLPLLRPALVAAFVLAFLPSLSELTKSILLYSPKSETLGVILFQLQEYSDRASAAVVGTLLLAAVLSAQSLLGEKTVGT